MTSPKTPDPSSQPRQNVRTAAAILGRRWLEVNEAMGSGSDPVKVGLYLAHQLERAGLITPEG